MFGFRPIARVLFPASLPALAILGLLMIAPLAGAQPRELTVMPGIDYFGRDYATRKDVSLEGCKSACLEDDRCKAFTFNVKAGWCFLKENAGERRPFDGAISGVIVDGAVTTPDLKATRLVELRFVPKRDLTRGRDTGGAHRARAARGRSSR